MTKSDEPTNMTSPPLLIREANDIADGFTDLDKEAYAWMMRFVGGRASADDLAALQDWARRSSDHAEAFDRVSRTWRSLEAAGKGLAAQDGAPLRLGRRAFLGGASAASAAGAVFLVAHPPLELWPSWSELNATYRTGVGEQRRVALAGNVSIDLNTRTSMAGGAEPELISGEAFITATTNAAMPFAMRAAGGRIVLTDDGSCNVRSEYSTARVTCMRGKVMVEHRGTMLSLTMGKQVSYSEQGFDAVIEIDPSLVSAWQQGFVIFQSTPVTEVVAEVNRYRAGRIILTNGALGRRLFNARLRIANIDRVVGQIEQAFGARSTALPGGIVLLG
jgi:transmembrane sensor